MKSRKSSVTRQPVWKKKGLWAAIIVLLFAASGAGWYFLAGPGKTTQAASSSTDQTHTTIARRGDILISASGSGTLMSGQSIDLSFSTSGTVEKLNVKIGDTVTAGQELAVMGNSETLQANEASAQYQLLQAQQTLNDLQSKADVTLATAYQTWLSAQDTYNTAVKADAHTSGARCSQDVMTRDNLALEQTKQILDDLTSKANGTDAWINARSHYDTALANYTYCASYTSAEKTNASATLQIAKTTMQQAETKYNTLKDASGIDPNQLALAEAKVTQFKAQLTQVESDLQGLTLTAPIDGKVVYLAASEGTIVDTSKFITVADINHLDVSVSVDETDMDKLVIGSTAEITFDALPDQVFAGKVVQVDPQLTTSGQYRVAKGLVELDEAAVKTVQKLPLNLTASVTIIDKQAKNAILIPLAALKDLGNKEYAVFVMNKTGQLQFKAVTVGLMDSVHAEITSGLNEGDVVSTGIAQTSK